jgi:hypothetical protein
MPQENPKKQAYSSAIKNLRWIMTLITKLCQYHICKSCHYNEIHWICADPGPCHHSRVFTRGKSFDRVLIGSNMQGLASSGALTRCVKAPGPP